MKRILRAIQNRRRFTWIASTAIIVLFTVAVTWLWAHPGHASLPTRGVKVDAEKGTLILAHDSHRALGVQTAEATLNAAEERLLAYASLTLPWNSHAFLTAKIPGRVAKLFVKAGDSVAVGQTLAEVESIELENLQLEILNAQNEVELSERILKSLEPLAQNGIVTERMIREKAAKNEENNNALEIAKKKWLSLGLSEATLIDLLREKNPRYIRTLPIVSPISGQVNHTDLAVGKIIEPAEHLLEIVDVSTLWVKIGVLERDLSRIRVGLSVELKLAALPNETFRATIQIKSHYLDPETHLGTVWGEIANPNGKPARLLPGMNGRAFIILPATKKRPSIPLAALIDDGLERYVFVEEAATAKAFEYKRRTVVVGSRSPSFAEIQGGDLLPGDRVVTTGSHELATFFLPGVLRLSEEAAKNFGLHVEAVALQQVDDTVEVEGIVDLPPDRQASASSQLAGTLEKIAVDRDQKVRIGDVLAEVASFELQNLQLELLRAQLQLRLLEGTTKRLQELQQIASKNELLETESLLNAARHRYGSIDRKLKTVGLSSAQIEGVVTRGQVIRTLPVRSPIDGIVVHFDKVLGQAIKAEEPLFEIHDLSKVLVQGFVAERDVALAKVGQTARMRFLSDANLVATGTIVGSSQMLGKESRSLPIWVEPKSPVGFALPQNMLARITVPLRQGKPTAAVPLTAVTHDGTRAYAFVETVERNFERRLVQTGRSDDRFIEILDGLKIGERIAVKGTTDLQTAYSSLR